VPQLLLLLAVLLQPLRRSQPHGTRRLLLMVPYHGWGLPPPAPLLPPPAPLLVPLPSPSRHGGCMALAGLQAYGDTVCEDASLSDGYQLRGADVAAAAVVSFQQGDACGSFVMPDGDGSALIP
jgi:hypothetical protein